MKKKIFITILIIFILLMCSMIGVWIFVHPKDATVTLAKDNEINENTIDISTNTIPDEVEPESNIIIAESEIVTEPEKEMPQQDEVVIEKTVSQTSPATSTSSNTTTTNKTIQNNTSNNAQNNKNTNTKSTTSTSNVENTKPKETPTTKPVETSTETKTVTQPTRCTHNNNHGMDVGNCGRWFNSKSEAIAYYEEKINYWGKLWESYQIEDSEYYKNCPTGYEYWSCMYCNKWTINLYYR